MAAEHDGISGGDGGVGGSVGVSFAGVDAAAVEEAATERAALWAHVHRSFGEK